MTHFCRDCIRSWNTKKIMDCDLCRKHLSQGWTTDLLLKVYGEKRDALDSLGWEGVEIFPPSPDRKPIETIANKVNKSLNLRNIKTVLNEPFHLLNEHYKVRLSTIKERLLKCQQEKEQYKVFLEKEYRTLNLYNMVTTYKTREIVWEAIDPLLQHIIVNLNEYAYL